MKKKFVAVLLAIVAGGFGAHKFYLRQPELGIAYIALFIWIGRFFGIPLTSFLGWYDAYKLMIMDDSEFDRKYNSYYFRDRYGRRLEKAREQTKTGKYFVLDDDQAETKRSTPKYLVNTYKKREGENYKQSGIKKFKDYDTKGAIEDFKKAIESNPDDKSLHFNIACAYSLEEKAYESFYHLDLAVTYGFKEWEKILNQEALAYIRILPAFELFKNNQFRISPSILNTLKNKDREQPQEAFILKQDLPIELKQELK
ncbi:MAG: TM2 domain-containing protein [Saprospiraceae bacterium]|nr:TM2 domain-containing protein [Saprospiraceae bacterium]